MLGSSCDRQLTALLVRLADVEHLAWRRRAAASSGSVRLVIDWRLGPRKMASLYSDSSEFVIVQREHASDTAIRAELISASLRGTAWGYGKLQVGLENADG